MHDNDEVNWYLKDLSKSPAHLKLLESSLGRLLKQAAARAEDWRMLCTDNQATLISEWLSHSLEADASWLKNLDDNGRIRKLVKDKSVDNLEKEALKILEKSNSCVGDSTHSEILSLTM
jgi:hypothetical protein